MKTILYAGPIGQKDTATCLHTQRRAKLFQKLNYTIHFCCEYPTHGECVTNSDFEYIYCKDYKKGKKIRSLSWLLEQVFGLKMFNLIKQKINIQKPDIIVLYDSASIILFLRILHLCKKNKIKLVNEITEWRQKTPENNWIGNLLDWQRNIQIKHLYKKNGNILVISEFLYSYFKSNGFNVIKIPPIYFEDDFINYKEIKHSDNLINLIFCGSLSNKDYLDSLIQAILILKNPRLHFSIAGPDKMEFTKKYDLQEMSKNGIEILGRLSHDKVIKMLKQSDFSVLLRENRQYAKAGVSTKFTEAMCMGVPSICTKVGGTDLFVQNGVNGFLIKDNSIESVISILKEILKMSEEDILKMKINAVKSAKHDFYYKTYEEQLEMFLEKIY